MCFAHQQVYSAEVFALLFTFSPLNHYVDLCLALAFHISAAT